MNDFRDWVFLHMVRLLRRIAVADNAHFTLCTCHKHTHNQVVQSNQSVLAVALETRRQAICFWDATKRRKHPNVSPATTPLIGLAHARARAWAYAGCGCGLRPRPDIEGRLLCTALLCSGTVTGTNTTVWWFMSYSYLDSTLSNYWFLTLSIYRTNAAITTPTHRERINTANREVRDIEKKTKNLAPSYHPWLRPESKALTSPSAKHNPK